MILVRAEGSIAYIASPELREALIGALDVFVPEVDPCEHGHVPHSAEDHHGAPIVHTYSPKLMVGADWPSQGAIDFIRSADVIGDAVSMGHIWARHGEQAYAFAVKLSTVWPPQ